MNTKRSSKLLRCQLAAVIILLFSTSTAFSQLKSVDANTPLAQAIRLMDRGQPDSSIAILNELLKKEPDDYHMRYELAFANYIKKDYVRSTEILESLTGHKDQMDILYQLLGNSYDLAGKPDKAVETYKAGLVKFPKSGKLYLEAGIMDLKKDDQRSAVINFQKGVAAEPMFPSNYYWLSKLWLGTQEEIWGMIYGELFMDLESNSGRTAEISKLLFDKYKSEIKVIAPGQISVSFSKAAEINPNETNPDKKLPYGMGTYERHLLMSLGGVQEININTLNDVRTGFIKGYFDSKSAATYPNVLFSYQKQILDAGHMDAYNHWILQKGDPELFKTWVQANQEKWTTFLQWFGANRLKITEDNKFSIDAYM